MNERNADQLYRLAPGDGLWPSSGPGLPQGLVSALALVLRGWHLGDFSPFGVNSQSTVVNGPYSSARHLGPVLIPTNEKHKLSKKLPFIVFSSARHPGDGFAPLSQSTFCMVY